MKLPEKPTNPYIRHNPQTLGDLSIRDHGTVSGALGVATSASSSARSEAINPRSAAFTNVISSGQSRNQGQKNTHHSNPSPAITQNGVVQVPKSKSSHKKM